MNTILYTCINKYNFNFPKMVIDTKLKFFSVNLVFNELSNVVLLVFVI